MKYEEMFEVITRVTNENCGDDEEYEVDTKTMISVEVENYNEYNIKFLEYVTEYLKQGYELTEMNTSHARLEKENVTIWFEKY